MEINIFYSFTGFLIALCVFSTITLYIDVKYERHILAEKKKQVDLLIKDLEKIKNTPPVTMPVKSADLMRLLGSTDYTEKN